MSDIRERIEEDRGWLKKIQMLVPGFRGYRIKEDIRDADRMLRDQLVDKLVLLREDLENLRRTMPIRFNSKEPEQIGSLISQYKTLESLISHAAFGYSGIAADIAIKEAELDRLYEYDFRMFEDLDILKDANGRVKTTTLSGDSLSAMNEIMNLRDSLNNFEADFKKRLDVIQDTVVSA